MIRRRRRRQIFAAVEDDISRVPRGAQFEQPQAGPFPQAQAPAGIIQMPNCGNLPVVGNGMPMGLPRYTSVDEYGRTFNPLITYGPQTHSAPVPVAKAPDICQMNPIISPVAFIPYAGQHQEMYQVVDEQQR